jgi:diguanylate cyclase (GGDEF)-like protein
MNTDTVLETVERVLLSRQLNPVERFILHESWIGRTYSEMAQSSGYGSIYLKEIGSQLWQALSQTMGERVTKKNLHLILKQYQPCRTEILSHPVRQKFSAQQTDADSPKPASELTIPFPSGPVPLGSPFYIDRPPVEELAYEEMQKPGCAIRIRAPQKMGKSSLLARIMDRAGVLGYRAVQIDFQEAEATIFSALDRFLRWFSANVSRQLNLESRLDEYWDEEMGSKVSCKIYFQSYLLEQIDSPLVLALNEVNRIFEYPEIVRDFLPMLRFWYEQARVVQAWQKLRLVLAHSTEIYVPLKLEQSPFNVGIAIVLPQFSLEQVQDLAQRYRLDWTEEQLAQLLAIVGGHPYLVRLALYHLARQELTLEQLLQTAPLPTGIYSRHLYSHLAMLQEEPELASALQEVVKASEDVELNAIAAYKLESMGLVKLEGNCAKPSCELYRLYFREQLAKTAIQEEAEVSHPYTLSKTGNVDELTQLANRRYFYQYLEAHWSRGERETVPISLILCDVDYFSFYIETHGYLAGNTALQRIAGALRDCIQHNPKCYASIAARYEGARFAALLPHSDAAVAVEVAESIRQTVKALAIAHDQAKLGGFPDVVLTVSVGVATLQPQAETSPEMLILSAEEALARSQRQGRDRVVC